MNEKFLSVAKFAAIEAGKLLMSDLDSVQSESGIKNLTTKQDKDSELLIIKILEKEFPDHGFLGEEFGEKNNSSQYKWIIDPIDGTNNYIGGRDTFSVSIALEKDGELILGVVFLPKRNELFHAVRGGGSFMNDEVIGTGGQEDLDKAVVTYSAYPGSEEENQSLNEKFSKSIFNLKDFGFANINDVDPIFGRGSMAAEFCYLACGRIDGLVRLKQKPWDVAAGSIIAKEAGAEMNNLKQGEVSIYEGEYISANRNLLEKLNKIMDN